MALTPFQILLNNLNNDLSGKDLRNLIHICGDHIPGCQQEGIRCGWDVFKILRQQNIIGDRDPEKIVNLLEIIKQLERDDLAEKVKKHIQEYYTQQEMEDFESSFESSQSIRVTFPETSSGPSTPIPSEDCCRIRCCGFTCNYNPHMNSCCNCCACNTLCNWCGVIAGVSLFLIAILASLAWYSGVPEVTKYLQSNDDIKRAGPFVIGFLGFPAICFTAWGIYLKCFKPRKESKYSELLKLHETVSNQANYGASDSTLTSSSLQSETAMSFSCSGQDTASSSLVSQ